MRDENGLDFTEEDRMGLEKKQPMERIQYG